LGTVEEFFGQRWFSPLEKIGPYVSRVLGSTLQIMGHFQDESFQTKTQPEATQIQKLTLYKKEQADTQNTTNRT